MGNPGTSELAAINGSLAVSPGVIDTPWWDEHPEALKRRIFEQVTASVPVRRIGREGGG